MTRLSSSAFLLVLLPLLGDARAPSHLGVAAPAPAPALGSHARSSTAAPADAPAAPARVARPSAIVDAKYAGADGAVVGGIARFRTIGAAVAAAPREARGRYIVYVRDGRYREKLLVDRPSVTLQGEERTKTVLTYDDVADTRGPDGQPLGTRGSWTLKVVAPDFRLERMTVENAFDYMGNYRKPADDPTRVKNAQALAVALGQGSDRAVFSDCVLSGHQDTLFPDAGRSYFRGCTILGSVDFIFGAGRAVFEDCDIVSRDRGNPQNNGYVTAASTPRDQPYGFVFLRDRLRKESPAMARTSVFLGRPWHPGADPNVHSAVVYIDCLMDDQIGAEGWTRMSSVDASGTRIWYEPADARFSEYGSKGPGAIASATRRTLTPEQAREYTLAKIFDGWVPDR